ncbi:hypothetical protein lerEdw1_006086 [Lerista edwardsae]|nr:hypothetical protein lerEdw1_006086 [Lerista edwardsae]
MKGVQSGSYNGDARWVDITTLPIIGQGGGVPNTFLIVNGNGQKSTESPIPEVRGSSSSSSSASRARASGSGSGAGSSEQSAATRVPSPAPPQCSRSAPACPSLEKLLSERDAQKSPSLPQGSQVVALASCQDEEAPPESEAGSRLLSVKHSIATPSACKSYSSSPSMEWQSRGP